MFGSLLFGFLAWGLAIAALKKPKRCTLLVSGSFVACCVSALWEFFEVRRMVFAGHWGGLEDTIDAIIQGIIIMMTVTVILNLLALAWRNAVAQAEKEEEEEVA